MRLPMKMEVCGQRLHLARVQEFAPIRVLCERFDVVICEKTCQFGEGGGHFGRQLGVGLQLHRDADETAHTLDEQVPAWGGAMSSGEPE